MNLPDEPDDFEYRLSDSDVQRCPACGATLEADGRCADCQQRLAKLAALEQAPDEEAPPAAEEEDDVELDEDGLPVNPRRRRRSKRWSELLELEEQHEGELPAAFYAIALAVVVVIGLASIVSNSPAAATWWIGLLMIVGGGAALGASYRWMAKDIEGDLRTLLGIPFRAVVLMLYPQADDRLPRMPSIDVGKWSLLAITMGVLCMMLSGVLSLIGGAI